MARKIDLTGKVFGRWTVLNSAGSDDRGKSLFECKCECGTIRIVAGGSLRFNKSNSCGCLRNESVSKVQKKSFLNEDGTRNCSSCNRILDINKFYVRNSNKDGLSSSCKECCYFSNIKRLYNIDKYRFFKLLEAQENKCPICEYNITFDILSNETKDIAVDHCHSTGEVRGILHKKCNSILVANHTIKTAGNLLKYLSI